MGVEMGAGVVVGVGMDVGVGVGVAVGVGVGVGVGDAVGVGDGVGAGALVVGSGVGIGVVGMGDGTGTGTVDVGSAVGVGLGVESTVGDGTGLTEAGATGVTGLSVEVGTSSGWQANSSDATARASMTTVAIVRTGPIRCIESCNFVRAIGEIQIGGSGRVYHSSTSLRICVVGRKRVPMRDAPTGERRRCNGGMVVSEPPFTGWAGVTGFGQPQGLPLRGKGTGSEGQLLACSAKEAVEYVFVAQLGEERSWRLVQ